MEGRKKKNYITKKERKIESRRKRVIPFQRKEKATPEAGGRQVGD